MPKIKKVRRSKKYRHNVNRKRLRNKQRKLPSINCDPIKKAWDSNKSTRRNLAQMGLAYDSNQIFKVPNIKQKIIKNTASGDFYESENEIQYEKKVPKNIKVALELEANAKAPRERRFQLPKGQVQFLTYLMDKYDDDYKAMSRDRKNHDQLTWRQIKSKISVFKNIPDQYAEYLLHKGEIVLDDPTPLEETRRKISEENLKKYSFPKKEKKKKSKLSLWVEHDMNDEDNEMDEFNTSKMLEDIGVGNGENLEKKKLKLFPDEESDDDNEDDDDDDSQKNINNVNKKNNSEKLLFNDSDDSDRDLDDENELELKGLDELSDEDLSEDDILDDEDFGTDSADDSDEE